MKRELLIEEHRAPVKVLESETPGLFRFEAIVSEADFLNRNRRVYPEAVLFPAFENFNALIDRNLAQPGLVDHPGFLDGSSVSDIGVKWEHFWFEGKRVVGRGRIVPTQKGRDLQAAMEAGIAVGFSTRGYGDFEEFEAEDGKPARRMTEFELESVDAVCDPSVLHARVRHYTKEESEKMEKELERARAELAAALEAKGASEARVAALETAVVELEATVAELEAAAAELEAAAAEAAELRRRLEASEARVVELEGKLAEVETQAAENALTAKLNELVEGHRFAATIIAEARELGVTLENAEKVVARLKALTEAAATASAEGASVAPKGDTSTEEDVEQPAESGQRELSAEQVEDLFAAGLITERRRDELLAQLG